MHHIRGFDELGGTEDFSTNVLEWIIGCHQGLHLPEGKEIPEELVVSANNRKGVNGVNIRTRYAGGGRGGVRDQSEEYDSE